MTVRELIKSSLKLINAIAVNETPSAVEQVDALNVLNEMLDGWSAEGILQFAPVREEFVLTAGESQKTVGATGNFVTSRPSELIQINVKNNSIEQPVELINIEQWSDINDKASSGQPRKVFSQGTFPNLTLNFYPVPNAADTLVIYSLKPFSTLTVDTNLSFPPGYQRALRYNLAKELAPEYGKEVSQLVYDAAIESLAVLKRKNTEPAIMASDAFGLAGTISFDINTGE